MPGRCRFLIVGTGALGSVIAHALTENGFDVTVVVRRAERADTLRSDGIREARTGSIARPRVVLQGLPTPEPFDFIVLATQPTQVQEAIAGLRDLIELGGPVVCVQNGLCEERLIAQIGDNRVIGAVVAFGASSRGDGLCERTRGGGIVIGRTSGTVDPALTRLAVSLSCLGRVRITRNLMGIRWSKLIVNCAVSTLGTIGGDRLGALLKKAYARQLALEIIGEGLNVARASGVRLERLPGTVPLEWLAATVGQPPSVRAVALRWAQHTAALGLGARYRKLRSSMLRAIEGGNPPAVDYLNGEIIERGRRLGVPTPINAQARDLVWAIARGQCPAAHDTLRSFYRGTRQ
jgi:2-dehydropantoate 2-reductase